MEMARKLRQSLTGHKVTSTNSSLYTTLAGTRQNNIVDCQSCQSHCQSLHHFSLESCCIFPLLLNGVGEFILKKNLSVVCRHFYIQMGARRLERRWMSPVCHIKGCHVKKNLDCEERSSQLASSVFSSFFGFKTKSPYPYPLRSTPSFVDSLEGPYSRSGGSKNMDLSSLDARY